jgi:hypothetical protein
MNSPKRKQQIFPIKLTEKEVQIQKILVQVAEEFKEKVQLRIAGGWVRDKVCEID